MVRAIMHGCNGKMGRAITTLAKEDAEVEIVAGVDAYTEVANEYPVFDSIEKCDVEADVVIDFSNAKAVDGLLDYCVEKQIPVVLCTTGLSEEQLQEVEEASKKVAVLRSANMSLGINLLMQLLKEATKVLSPAGYDIEIVEKHHNQKLDAPSGTAIALADSINEAADGQYEYVYDRSQVRKKRDKKNLEYQPCAVVQFLSQWYQNEYLFHFQLLILSIQTAHGHLKSYHKNYRSAYNLRFRFVSDMLLKILHR